MRDFTKILYKSHKKASSCSIQQVTKTNPKESEEYDFQCSHIKILKMFSFQQKLRGMKRKYHPFTEKNILTEMIPEEVQALNLTDEDFKSTVLNMLKELKKTIGKGYLTK